MTDRLSARLLELSAALALVALALVSAPPVAAQDEGGVVAARAHGVDRYATAAAVAQETFDTSASAIIASGQDFPDALVASYGPVGIDAPILLSQHREVPQVTLDALDALEVGEVFLIGGEAVLHGDVETQLRDAGFDTLFRVAGDDRYGTAAAMLDGPQAPEIGTLEGDATALLASGESFPDALAAGPVASAASFPLLLTPTHAPHEAIDAALAEHGIDRIIVVGGTAAVSADVVEHYQDAGYEVERWSGDDRWQTAAVVADNALARLGFDAELTLLARGDAFPDALAASVHGGVRGAPILLTASPEALGAVTDAWFEAACPAVEVIRAIGGTAAVSEAALSAAVQAAERCLDEPTITVEPACAEIDDSFTVTARGLEPGVDYSLVIDPVPADGLEAGATAEADADGVAELPGTLSAEHDIQFGTYTWTVSEFGEDEVLASTEFEIAESC